MQTIVTLEMILMGRIRTIKPEFWKDEELSELPEVCHMFAAALLNYADDEGFFNANEKLIKAELFPLREPSMSIHGMLTELSNMGYLKFFRGPKGKIFGQVVNFTLHQKVNRPSKSKIKELIDFTEDSMSPHCAFTEGSLPERKGTGNREQGKKEEPAAQVDPKDLVWKIGTSLLIGQGESEPNARKFLGKLVKDYGLEETAKAIGQAGVQKPAETKSYLLGILKTNGQDDSLFRGAI